MQKKEETQMNKERLKQTLKNMGVIFKNMGSQAGKILKNMDEAEKKMQEQMKQATTI